MHVPASYPMFGNVLQFAMMLESSLIIEATHNNNTYRVTEGRITKLGKEGIRIILYPQTPLQPPPLQRLLNNTVDAINDVHVVEDGLTPNSQPDPDSQNQRLPPLNALGLVVEQDHKPVHLQDVVGYVRTGTMNNWFEGYIHMHRPLRVENTDAFVVLLILAKSFKSGQFELTYQGDWMSFDGLELLNTLSNAVNGSNITGDVTGYEFKYKPDLSPWNADPTPPYVMCRVREADEHNSVKMNVNNSVMSRFNSTWLDYITLHEMSAESDLTLRSPRKRQSKSSRLN